MAGTVSKVYIESTPCKLHSHPASSLKSTVGDDYICRVWGLPCALSGKDSWSYRSPWNSCGTIQWHHTHRETSGQTHSHPDTGSKANSFPTLTPPPSLQRQVPKDRKADQRQTRVFDGGPPKQSNGSLADTPDKQHKDRIGSMAPTLTVRSLGWNT